MTASWYPPLTAAPVPSSAPATVRVVIADPLTLFREALQATLAAAGGFAVVGGAGDTDEVIRSVQEQRPHVLVLSLAVPPDGGLDALRQLNDSDTGVRTVVLADEATRADVVTALTLGAHGVLTRDVSPSLMFECLRTVTQGHCWIGGECVRNVVEAVHRVRTEPPPKPAETLTPREVEIVAAVTDGATNRDIGATLRISEQTVKNHLSHVFEKLGVSSRLELALYGICRAVELQRRVRPAPDRRRVNLPAGTRWLPGGPTHAHDLGGRSLGRPS
jgi:two-component system, NarL family, nitrate/nitrite response regulator NarL